MQDDERHATPREEAIIRLTHLLRQIDARQALTGPQHEGEIGQIVDCIIDAAVAKMQTPPEEPPPNLRVGTRPHRAKRS